VFFPINVDVPMTRLPVANWLLILLVTFVSWIAWSTFLETT